MLAALNLKAGRLALTYSDINAALKLFEHGISFLESDHWHSQYVLSIDIFDSAADAGE
jgi:predicted ATPase